jgi:hypothetical protein
MSSIDLRRLSGDGPNACSCRFWTICLGLCIGSGTAENLKGCVIPIPGVGGGLVQSTEERALAGVRTPERGLPETVLAALSVRSIPADIGTRGRASSACSRAVRDRLTILLEAFLFKDGRVTLSPVGRFGCVGSGMMLTRTGSSATVACSITATCKGDSCAGGGAGVSDSVSKTFNGRDVASTAGPKLRLTSGGARLPDDSSETRRQEISSCVGVDPSAIVPVEAAPGDEICATSGIVELK